MTRKSPPLIVLAAGGTGGHVFPAEALASELLQRGYRLALITDRRGGTYGGVLGELDTYRVRAGGIAGRGLAGKLQSIVEIALGVIKAAWILRRTKPQVVVGFGGYASVPTMVAACMGTYKTAIHEQNAVFGRANRALASRVDRIITCFEEIEALDKTISDKTIQSGMPVRPAIAAMSGAPYPALDSSSPFKILVLGGSQGARVLSDVIPAAMADLPEDMKNRVELTQQCRPEDLQRVKDAYDQSGIKAELSSFFENVPQRMAHCHLVISRCGASTVAEALVVGRPSILVPYPYATDDHQTKNAHAVDEAGAGWLMPEPAFTPETLCKRLRSLFEAPETLRTAAACAKAAARPDAAAQLANVIEELAHSNKANDNAPQKGRMVA